MLIEHPIKHQKQNEVQEEIVVPTPKRYIDDQLADLMGDMSTYASHAEKHFLKEVMLHASTLRDVGIDEFEREGIGGSFLVRAIFCVLEEHGFVYTRVPAKVARECEKGTDMEATIPIKCFQCQCRLIDARVKEEI